MACADAPECFSPPDLILPVSAAILERIDACREVLETYSRRVLREAEAHGRRQCRELNDIPVISQLPEKLAYSAYWLSLTPPSTTVS